MVQPGTGSRISSSHDQWFRSIRRQLVFDPLGKADLSGISEGVYLYVNLVEHVANITVGEKGTKAAAATAIGVVPTSGSIFRGLKFTVDHPFAFAIMDDATGIPVFEGVVTDPSQ